MGSCRSEKPPKRYTTPRERARQRERSREEVQGKQSRRERWGRLRHLVAAQAGEVLLIDGRTGGATGGTTAAARSTSSRGTTRGTRATGSTAARSTAGRTVTTGSAVTATATTATTGGGAGAGLLNEAEVDVKEVLLLALLLALGLLTRAREVSLLLLVLNLLGVGPLLVLLDTLVGGADGLGSQALAGSLLSEVVAEGLGVVGLLNLLSGSLGSVLLGLGELLTLALIVPGLLAALGTPALLDLLASVARVVVSLCS
jgi:hypothetical protein